MVCLSRRTFIKALAFGSATLACAGCSGSGTPAADMAAGNVSDLPVGTLEAVPGASLALGRDAAGLYAMTSICTHQQCDMTSQGSITDQGLFCACHGSRFDANGQVVQGPAQQSLAHFSVTVDATGAITIHPAQSVDASARTAVG